MYASKNAYENSAALNGSSTSLLPASSISAAFNRSLHQLGSGLIRSFKDPHYKRSLTHRCQDSLDHCHAERIANQLIEGSLL
jgi:hypothetical protein